MPSVQKHRVVYFCWSEVRRERVEERVYHRAIFEALPWLYHYAIIYSYNLFTDNVDVLVLVRMVTQEAQRTIYIQCASYSRTSVA